MLTRSMIAAAAVSLFALASGCSRPVPTGPVSGTVTLSGKPLEQVLVVFQPVTQAGQSLPRSAGVTDSDGRYRLRTDDGRDGAIVGPHRVTFEDMRLYANPRTENSAPGTPHYEDRIPSYYHRTGTTPATYEVQATSQVADFDLTAEAQAH